ncbi:MAG: hypothetical protein AAF726_19325 [Planctomycetota bacterium]
MLLPALPLSLVVALGDPSHAAEVDLLAAIPKDTFLAVHAPDPRGLVASRETSSWLGFAMDPEWNSIVGPLLSVLDVDADPDEMALWRDRLFQALADANGFVAFVGDGFGDGDPVLGILADGGPDAAALLRTLLAKDATPETIAGGHEVHISDEGRGELYYERDGIILVLSTPTVENVRGLASECLDALGAGVPRGPFGLEGLAAQRRGAALELAVDMSQLWAEIERVEEPTEGIESRVFDAIASFEWLYGSMTFGDGETSDMRLVAPYGETTLLGELLAHFGAADTSLFADVPAGMATATVASFDVAGCTDWLMDVVEDTSEEGYEMMRSGLSAVTETVGIDVLGDFAYNATGRFLAFSSAPTDEDAPVTMSASQGTTFVMEVKETLPIVDAVEILLEMSGFGADVETESAEIPGDEDGLEVWRMAPDLALEDVVEIGLAAGGGRLVVSTNQSSFDRYITHMGAGEGAPTLLNDPELAAAAEGAHGAMVSLQSMDEIADQIRSMASALDDMTLELGAIDRESGSTL